MAKLASFDIVVCLSALIVIALIGWWYSRYFYFAMIVLALLLRLGEPSQIFWKGPGSAEMRGPIESFLKLGHHQVGTNDKWDVWARNRSGWKRWLPNLNVFVLAEHDTITVRGPRDVTSLLRTRFP